MTRNEYIPALLRLYLEQPDTPHKPSRADWAVASSFYQKGFALEQLAHAIRLAALRRYQRSPEDPPLEPIRSLAYYRQVFAGLGPEYFHPGYVRFIESSYNRRIHRKPQSTLSAEPKNALKPPESRGS